MVGLGTVVSWCRGAKLDNSSLLKLICLTPCCSICHPHLAAAVSRFSFPGCSPIKLLQHFAELLAIMLAKSQPLAAGGANNTGGWGGWGVGGGLPSAALASSRHVTKQAEKAGAAPAGG